jgi:hypothetical protein
MQGVKWRLGLSSYICWHPGKNKTAHLCGDIEEPLAKAPLREVWRGKGANKRQWLHQERPAFRRPGGEQSQSWDTADSLDS